MTPDEAAVAVIDALAGANIAFMVVGSVASNFHGIPRATRDADFVIRIVPGALDAFAAALPAGLTLDPQSSFETLSATTRYIVTLERSPFICELFLLSDDPHDLARFERRERVHLFGRVAFVATAEDMVITKLQWSRGKDRLDIQNLIAVRGPDLDWSYIEHWARQHGTHDRLTDIRRATS